MSFRIEEKIAIDNSQVIDFKNFLIKKTAKQIYKKRKIQSLYFDNLNYSMYNDSFEGLVPRKKIRVRNYPETEDLNLYLETKISSVEGRYKIKKKITKEQFNNMKKNGFFDSQYGLCKPCLYVTYDRQYFRIGDVRISVDQNINYKMFSNNIHKNDDNSIIELKTSIKKNVDELIEDFPFQRKRFSKYCNGLEKTVLR